MENITKIFNQVRHIPYSIPLSIKEKDCCCSGKHKILKQLLENLGYKVRYRVISFKWDSMNLPSELTNIPHQNISTHVYLEVLINNKWLDMDATWDIDLKNIFPINNWDGISNNIIAVPVLKKFSLKKSQEIMNSETEDEINKDLKINEKFYQNFNYWLQSIRQQ